MRALTNCAMSFCLSFLQLMDLKAYIKTVENETIFAMEKKLVQTKNRLAFLVDYASFSPAEMRLNANTFMWHGRMPSIFEEHRMIINEKRSQFEDALKVRPRVYAFLLMVLVVMFDLL